MDNVPLGFEQSIDDEYSSWTECLVCEGSWKGNVCLCDCYENNIYNSENENQ